MTANLSNLTTANMPLGASITWHSSATASDSNKINDVSAINGTSKIYAAFYDSVKLCYSPTREITVYSPICATNDNYLSTPIIAGVGGTLPSIFANDTYNGQNISLLPPNSVQFLYELWTPSNATVDLTGDGCLIIPSTTAPGIYTYMYKICDKDDDAVSGSNCNTATITFVVKVDSDSDGIVDDNDLDDDNDGILDSEECSNSYTDLLSKFGAGALTNIAPSDFGLTFNQKNQNVSADLSAKFGYPANSGAIIVSITNASVHPSADSWWTKAGQQPSKWNVTGTMSAFLVMANDLLYYANDSKTIHIYDGATLLPIIAPAPASIVNQAAVSGAWSITDN